ncbi:MAG: hypothetical protein J3R72DRAFT_429949 [Linnemannia gamsii]|nr:MAG: hypothetical protein J3R72DRAFT_429949 [Linnemannia gamsii]
MQLQPVRLSLFTFIGSFALLHISSPTSTADASPIPATPPKLTKALVARDEFNIPNTDFDLPPCPDKPWIPKGFGFGTPCRNTDGDNDS